MDNEVIISKYGLEGYAIINLIIHKIYDDEGYFCRWDEDRVFLFSRYYGVKADFVSDVVADAISRGIFSKTLYEKHQILSSEEIQSTFFEATRKRKSLNVIDDYVIVEKRQKSKNSGKNEKNSGISEENDGKNEQRKRNERKGEEMKGEEMKDASADAAADKSAFCESACGTTAEKEKEKIDFDKVGESFNRICISLTPVQAMSGRRKTAISETYPYVKDRGGFEKLFEEVKNSGFLCGKNKNGWKATFDWIIKADNALKILEGNFRDKKEKQGSFDTDDFFLAALKRSYGDNFSEEELRCSL